ncbi:MAG: hypothetical protein ACJAV2_002883 [Myxococcota bacterium]|jgi:hypothetical protein
MVAVFVVACTGSEEPDNRLPTAVAWEFEHAPPTLEHEWFSTQTLPELSLFAHHESGMDRPTTAHRGPFGVGNGQVFAMAGLASPLNTLHGALGPTLQRRGRFFGDVSSHLIVDGQAVDFDAEWIARPRGTGLIVTRADAGDVTLYTVDAAIVSAGDAQPVIGRWLLVRSPSPHTITVRMTSAQSLTTVGGYSADVIDESGRLLAMVPWQGDLQGRDVSFGMIEGDATAAVAFVAALDAGDLQDAIVALPSPEAAFSDTLLWWTDWSATGVQLATDDPGVADLYDGLRVGVRMQQADSGAFSPLSRYTSTWLRDTNGPVRFFSRAGLFDEARAGIDYLHLCHSVAGDYVNSCSNDLVPADLDEAPLWSELPPLAGRVSTEGPSYIPLAVATYTRWSGDRSLMDGRWPWVRRGLLGQPLQPGGEQGFSGDETFRFAMGVGLGYPGEYPWQDLAWSANSAFLTVAASDALLDVGPTDSVADIQSYGDQARRALDEVFWQEEGWWTPFVFHTDGTSNATGDVGPAPYEDVSLKAAWLRVFPKDDSRLLSDLTTLAQTAGRGDGTFQTAPVERVDVQGVVDLSEGVCTGMTPGYALAALTYTGRTDAGAAFDALHAYAGPSGQFAEGIAYADKAALQFLYDPNGVIGDTVARFRPWEGAIVGDALLDFLVGAEPVSDGLIVSPHLPPGRRWMEVTGVSAGGFEVDVRVEQQGSERIVTVSLVSDVSANVYLRVPVVSEPTTVDTPVGATISQRPGGEWWVILEPVELQPGESATVHVYEGS